VRVLLFDVRPWADTKDQYLSIAAALRPQLEASGGCEFIDRFRRVVERDEDERWLLSFQYWRDEASMVRWRKHAIHHEAQQTGRDSVFEDYRLRVGEVLRERTPMQAAQQVAEPPQTAAFALMIESQTSALEAHALDSLTHFKSIYRPGRYLHVGCTTVYRSALAAFDAACSSSDVSHVAIAAIDRDYGMFERAQAPQSFAAKA
jgi:heme-degrading monooxygenase HmoA